MDAEHQMGFVVPLACIPDATSKPSQVADFIMHQKDRNQFRISRRRQVDEHRFGHGSVEPVDDVVS